MTSWSVRARLTTLVVVMTGVLALVVAVGGVSLVEDRLIDDAIDAEVARVVPEGKLLGDFGVFGPLPLDDFDLGGELSDLPPLDLGDLGRIDVLDELLDPEQLPGLAEVFGDVLDGDPLSDLELPDDLIAVLPELPLLVELATGGLDQYGDELEKTVEELDEIGALDDLLTATQRTRSDGLPVLTGFGVIAQVGIDGAPTTFSFQDPAEHEGALTIDANLVDVVAGAKAFDPGEVLDDVLTGDDGAARDELLARLGDDGAAVGGEVVVATRSVADAEVAVAVDVSDVTRSVDQVRTLVWLAMPVLMVLGGLATWILTGRALSPVRRISRQVSSISTGTLHERVPVPDTGDEVQELAETMNGMLDRLERDDRRLRRFVSDASHELRSPIAVLRNEAEVAQRAPEHTDVRELADGVLGESMRLQRLVDDLLLLARAQEPGRDATPGGSVDLDDVVLAEAQRTRRVPVDTAAVSAGRVGASPEDARRLVTHLLDNATRHARSAVSVGLQTSAGWVELVIDDDGPGIAPEDRQRVFERFTRLEDARSRDTGGAGLGLAVVEATASSMGGSCYVEQAPRLGGARFVVRVPAVD